MDAFRPESLEHLLSAVARSDRAAFRQLYQQTARSLFPICLRMLRDRGRAEEALQDGFLRIWNKAAAFDPDRGSAAAWMATVVRRCALDALRRRPNRELALEEMAEEAALQADEGSAGINLDAKAVQKCLDRLNPNQARAIVLAYMYGMTHEEVAHAMDSPLGTVKSWVRRGLVQLKECMDQ